MTLRFSWHDHRIFFSLSNPIAFFDGGWSTWKDLEKNQSPPIYWGSVEKRQHVNVAAYWLEMTLPFFPRQCARVYAKLTWISCFDTPIETGFHWDFWMTIRLARHRMATWTLQFMNTRLQHVLDSIDTWPLKSKRISYRIWRLPKCLWDYSTLAYTTWTIVR